MTGPLKVAILASGEGTTLEALARRWETDAILVRIVLVVSDRPQAHAVERAGRLHLPTLVLPRKGRDLESWSQELSERLSAAGTELVVLAGFLSILPPSWVETWKGRALNLHPSLLPRYGGAGMHGFKVHQAVIAAREPETGATVHLVTTDVDAGPILAQARLPVLAADTPETLRARLAPVEVALLSETVLKFARGERPLPYR